MSYIRKRLKGIEDCFRFDPGINVPFILLQIGIQYKNKTHSTNVSMKRLGHTFALEFYQRKPDSSFIKHV